MIMRIGTLLVVLASSAQAQDPSSYYIPPDESLWTNRIYVLLQEEDKASAVLEAIDQQTTAALPIDVLRSRTPVAGLRVLSKASSFLARTSARARLSRYLVLEFDIDEDLEAVVRELARDPSVLFAGIDSLVEISTEPSVCGNESDPLDLETEFSNVGS